MAEGNEKDPEKTLAWFLGPKAENAQFFEDMLNDIFRDYTYWRKNYFPEDPILITKKMQPQLQDGLDQIHQNVQYMMAELRRNFPFYSPRYFGHMLSEVTMPSMLAYFAGMLFNPNNVTTEAAPVTAEWEIVASNWLLEMLGYQPSPAPPSVWKRYNDKKDKDNGETDEIQGLWKDYSEELTKNFGWGHITSGGTVANIEALWVARTIKYYPIAIFESYQRAKEVTDIYEELKIEEKQSEKDELEKQIKEKLDFEGITIVKNPIPVIDDLMTNYDNDKDKVCKHLINLPPQKSIELLEDLYNSISIELFNTEKEKIETETKIEIYAREIDELIDERKSIAVDLNKDIKGLIAETLVEFEGNRMSLLEFKNKLKTPEITGAEESIKKAINKVYQELADTSGDNLNNKISGKIADKYSNKIDDFDEKIKEAKDKKEQNEKEKLKKRAILKLLNITTYWTDLPGLMSKYPGFIFYPETAHYSIKKAADILGISRKNLVKIKVDGNFRMDIINLKKELNKFSNPDYPGVPIAVIGVFGTTEEGAIDPIDQIAKCRKDFEDVKAEIKKDTKLNDIVQNEGAINNEEKDKVFLPEKFSFWIHVDAAYGGFFSTLLKITEKDKFLIKLQLFYHQIYLEDNKRKYNELSIREKISIDDVHTVFQDISNCKTKNDFIDGNTFKNYIEKITAYLNKEKYAEAKSTLEDAAQAFAEKNLKIDLEDGQEKQREYILKSFENSGKANADKTNVDKANENKPNDDQWPSLKLMNSYKSIKNCNSVTIDPHKMGYIQYPCGFVAFKNDKIRNFITQEAPYITTTDKPDASIKSAGQDESYKTYQTPPRHVAEKNGDGETVFSIEQLVEGRPPTEPDYKIAIEAFASYMLEGSKPGAAAAALWLTLKTIKPDRDHYGAIIKDSILASAYLYNKIKSWNAKENKEHPKKCKLYALSNCTPDTNVVVFFVAPLEFNSDKSKQLSEINKITKAVYDKFTIHAEHGDRKTSYSQPFFLSQTKMDHESYSFETLKELFKSEGLEINEKMYNEYGLNILRASMMNPYIQVYKRKEQGDGGLELIDEFLTVLNNAVPNS